MGLGDLNGIMRGKRFPASHWDTTCKSGNAMSAALFAIDMTCVGTGRCDVHELRS